MQCIFNNDKESTDSIKITRMHGYILEEGLNFPQYTNCHYISNNESDK